MPTCCSIDTVSTFEGLDLEIPHTYTADEWLAKYPHLALPSKLQRCVNEHSNDGAQ